MSKSGKNTSNFCTFPTIDLTADEIDLTDSTEKELSKTTLKENFDENKTRKIIINRKHKINNNTLEENLNVTRADASLLIREFQGKKQCKLDISNNELDIKPSVIQSSFVNESKVEDEETSLNALLNKNLKLNADLNKEEIVILDELDNNNQTEINTNMHHEKQNSANVNQNKKYSPNLKEKAATNKATEMTFKNSSESKKPKRKYEYEAIEMDSRFEDEIETCKQLSQLNEDLIYYMVLRDINYFIDIFSGNCEHSWRHSEYKKFSKKTGNLLYERTALTCFTEQQYKSALKALQWIFCKKDNKYVDYIIKVLLPEALIKITMRIYQCGKQAAEDYLCENTLQTAVNCVPKNSARLTNEPSKATST